jgi:hypothetical protein
MSEYDLHTEVNGAVALDLTAISTDTTTAGNIIDTKGYEAIEFFVWTGTLTDGTYTVLLEEGDDSGLSDAAAVDSSETLGTLPVIPATGDDSVYRVGSIGKKRYQRLSIVSASTTSGGTLGSIAVLGYPQVGPVADQSA